VSSSTEGVIGTGAASRGALLRGLFLLALTALMWGVNWPVNKFVLGELPPFTARACTGLIGVVLFTALARLRGETLRPEPAQWQPLLISTFLNFTCWMGFTAAALVWLAASEAVIVAYTLPIWAALLAWPILGEQPRLARVAGLAVGLSGLLVLMADQPLTASWRELPGIACVAAAAILFALGTVLAKREPVTLPPLASVAWQVGLGTLPLVLAAFAFERPDFAALTPLGWCGLFYTALLGLGLGYVTWFAALRLLPAGTAATGALMVPVVGVFSAAAMLGEPLGLRQLLALGLTLAGIALAARR
jgi:probable blue pigment (indigoidine) exporter